MNFSPLSFVTPDIITLGMKIIILIIIGILGISAFMLATKIRSFNKILFLPPNSGGEFIQRVCTAYFVTVVVLFLLALLVL
ncbi:MAG TPA: hypothetical protein VLF20_00175 [Patescibacteria group bacterium]|nr:hypothetical protein [Patescibacteria group bacterium]